MFPHKNNIFFFLSHLYQYFGRAKPHQKPQGANQFIYTYPQILMYLLFRLRQDNRTVLAGKEYAGYGVVGKEGVDVQVRIGEKLHIVLMFPEIGRYLLFGFSTCDQEHTDGGIVFVCMI